MQEKKKTLIYITPLSIQEKAVYLKLRDSLKSVILKVFFIKIIKSCRNNFIL